MNGISNSPGRNSPAIWRKAEGSDGLSCNRDTGPARYRPGSGRKLKGKIVTEEVTIHTQLATAATIDANDGNDLVWLPSLDTFRTFAALNTARSNLSNPFRTNGMYPNCECPSSLGAQ